MKTSEWQKLPDDLKELVGKRVVIVADDVRGYGVKTKYVGQKGTIIGWRHWKHGRVLPQIRLDSEEVVSSSKMWWRTTE